MELILNIFTTGGGWLYLGVGALAGVLAGLLGVGGGLVIVPALLLAFGWLDISKQVAVHMAIGTSLATILITSLAAIHAHQRRRAVRWDLVVALTPGIVVGVGAGALIAAELTGSWLQRIFAIFLLGVSLQMFRGGARQPLGSQPGARVNFLAGSLIGVVSALVGIGGGTLTVPYLSASGSDMRTAVATSSACGFPIAFFGTLGFIWTGWNAQEIPWPSLGYVYLPAWFGIIITSALFAPLGAGLAHRLPLSVLQRIFAALLLIIGLRLLLG